MKDKKCDKTKFVSRYIDDELNAEKYAEMKKHIESCLVCQSEYMSLKKVDDFLSLYKEENIPDILNQKILSNSQIYKPQSRNYFMRPLAMAASFLIAFVLGIYISNASLNANSNDIVYDFGSGTLYSLIEGGN